LRLGEAFHCVYATQSPEGCGTAEFCQTCGVIRAVIGVPGENTSSCKWHIAGPATGVDEIDDLIVTASPIQDQEGFVVCTLADFSHEKQRQAVERMFFHDILNTAAAVAGFAALLRDELADGVGCELAEMVDHCASELLAELRGQQLLSKAEDGRLSIMPKVVRPLDLVRMVAAAFRNYSQSKERTIVVDPVAEDLRMETYPAILSRVLGNMLKSALLATPPGGTVTIGCQATQGGVEFCVHNPSFIPQETQSQIFPRSPSSKDGVRGLSAFSMKFLTERYLGGTVGFESGPLHGARLVARYPLTVTSAGAKAMGQSDPV